jgi:hypothetical protein
VLPPPNSGCSAFGRSASVARSRISALKKRFQSVSAPLIQSPKGPLQAGGDDAAELGDLLGCSLHVLGALDRLAGALGQLAHLSISLSLTGMLACRSWPRMRSSSEARHLADRLAVGPQIRPGARPVREPGSSALPMMPSHSRSDPPRRALLAARSSARPVAALDPGLVLLAMLLEVEGWITDRGGEASRMSSSSCTSSARSSISLRLNVSRPPRARMARGREPW